MAITIVTSVSDEIKEKRFTKGVFCPHCSSKHTVRNGKTKQLFEATILVTNNCISRTLWNQKMPFS